MRVAELSWQLDLPWWRHEGQFFVLRPREVLANPDRYREQFERTLVADLGHPIDLAWRRGRWFILDGVHRLLRAVQLERHNVAVRKVPASALKAIATENTVKE